MKDLINVGELYTQNKMSSLQIADATGKEHKNIIRDIDILISKGIDKLNFELTSYKDKSNRYQRMYSLTMKGCLILASGYDPILREKIINRWEELELNNKQNFEIPTTLSGALMLAARQAEQLEKQEVLLLEQAPKVEFYEAVTGSSDTIDMRSVATTLNCGLGRNKIFAILRNKKILDNTNKPYQTYIDRGYFRTIESSYTKSDGTQCINIKTVVFQKGLDFIRKTLNN